MLVVHVMFGEALCIYLSTFLWFACTPLVCSFILVETWEEPTLVGIDDRNPRQLVRHIVLVLRCNWKVEDSNAEDQSFCE